MSQSRVNVCRLILRENYGDFAEKIGFRLLRKGTSSLRDIASETALSVEQVKKTLCLFIQQNIVTFERNKKGFIEYSTDFTSLLWRVRYPKYIYCAKTLYGDAAELLVEELLSKGQVMMSRVVESVTDKLNEALDASGHPRITTSVVKDKFSCLAKTHFLQRCPDPVKQDDKVVSLPPPDSEESESLFDVPAMEIDGDQRGKRKRSTDSVGEQMTKKLKTEDGNDTKDRADDGIYWRVNFPRFHQHFRDQALVSAISSKIDKKAGEILRTMLRVNEVKTDPMAIVTNPLSVTEIQQALSKDCGMTRHVLEQYLNLLSDDTANFVTKVGDSGGGMYVVNIYEALRGLCQAHIESVVLERFGSKCLRIFLVLVLKKHLEQKQIEELAMIPAKEAKELLYTMFGQNFISVTEIAKTPDHAPSRTFYLFKINVNQVAKMLLERCYKALQNAWLRRGMETAEHKRLLDKQERVEAIAASLEQSGADPTQKEEIEQTITPPERQQIAKVKNIVNILDQSELQLDDTIFILEMYLIYATLKKKFAL